MKRTLMLVTVILLLAFGVGIVSAQSGYDLYQKALVKERAVGDVEGAIRLYQRIVTEFAGNRALAAKAQLRIGLLYHRLGRKADAQKAFRAVVSQYSEQASGGNYQGVVMKLQSGFESVRPGRGLLLWVAGEPRIGKTTLVEDFHAALAAEAQCTIARGRCSERLAGTEAYLPLLEALEDLVQSGSNPSAARVMKQIAPTWYAHAKSLQLPGHFWSGFPR